MLDLRVDHDSQRRVLQVRQLRQHERLRLKKPAEGEIHHRSPSGILSQARSASEGRLHKKILAFGWYGGKFSHLNWLLRLLPASHHYCEPFGGSAAVLINRSPSPVETYNDLDG